VLYRSNTGGAISGGIVTYQVGGKQYVAVTSGAATRFWRVPPAFATVVVFSLPKTEN
jgi:alcohol dehydrogenase (cytochrome c)